MAMSINAQDRIAQEVASRLDVVRKFSEACGSRDVVSLLSKYEKDIFSIR